VNQLALRMYLYMRSPTGSSTVNVSNADAIAVGGVRPLKGREPTYQVQPIAIATLPKCAPLAMCENASFACSNGKTLSMTGFIWLTVIASANA
jgi:hypothetical protein